MIVYYTMIAAVVILGLFAQFFANSVPATERISKSGVLTMKNHYGIAYPLLFFVFCFVGGFRYYVGTDFGGYYKFYNYNWEEIVDFFKAFDEPGLKLVAYLARNVWDDGVSVILFASIITTFFVFYGISKYDNNDITTMLLIYVFIAGWTFSLNGVRQAMAGAIVFAFSKVGKKNWILKYALICFIAYLFHTSALMMIPILLLSHRKIDKTQIFLLLVSAIAIPLFFDFAFDFMGVNLADDDSLVYIEREINPIRVAVAFAPLILLFFLEDREDFLDRNGFIVNLVIFNAILTLTTRNSAYLNRFSHYTNMFLMPYYPAVFKGMSKNLRIFAIISVMVLYFFYFRYELTNGVDEVVWQWSFSHFGEW